VIFVATLWLVQAATAVEVRRPSDDEVAALRKAVGDANASQLGLDEARVALERLRRKIAPDRKKIKDLSERIESLRGPNAALHNEVLRQAVEIFGLAPPQKKLFNRDKDGPFGGVGTTWQIWFQEGTSKYGMVDKHEKPRFGTYDTSSFYGIAFADGMVWITPKAFQSGAFLAAVILHERVHFDQYTAPDGPNGHRPDLAMRELFARQAVLARRDVLGLSDAELRRLDEDLSHRYRYLTTAPWSMELRVGLNEDHAADEGEAKRLSALIVDWGLACGFKWTGSTRMEFTHARLSDKVTFRARDIDGARAAMMLASACLDDAAPDPCVDAMEPLDLFWGNARFRDSLLLAEGSSDWLTGCMYYFYDHYQPGGGFEGVRAVAADYEESLLRADREESARQAARERARQAAKERDEAWERQQEFEREFERKWRRENRASDRQECEGHWSEGRKWVCVDP